MGLSDNYEGNADYIKWDYKEVGEVEGGYVGVREFEGEDYVAPILMIQEDGEALETSVAGFRSVLADKIYALQALKLAPGTRVQVVSEGKAAGKRYYVYNIYYEADDGSIKKVFTPKGGASAPASQGGRRVDAPSF